MLALADRGLAVRHGACTARPQSRRAVMVRSMLGPYQYKTRVARLRLKGFPVYEFGERVMQEGSFGDDVMQLQAYLSEQGYFSSEDGLSGYFGSVTGDALQAWQGDHGLRVTGVFDADSKWTYLKQQEAAVHQTVAAQQAQPVVVVRPPSVPESWRVAQPGLSSGLLGLAALVAGTHLARTRLKDARRVPGVAELGRVLRWTVHTLAGATALANRALLRAVLHALEAQPDSPPPQQRRRPATAPASSPAPGSPLVDEQSECGNAAAALAARQVAAEEAAYLAAMAAVVAPASPAPAASPKPARRLSEDELQQRIAVMKGEVSPRTPVPQRSPPRKLPLGVPKPTDGDRITGSKYGTYYGGRQVRDSVKEYLDGGAGPGSRPANTPARRMEANGYQIGGRPRPASKPAKPAPAHAPAPVMAALAAPAPEVEVEVMAAASGPETFRDVEAAAQQATAIGSGGLLNGTELEKSPERRGPPVPVVKPGMASPSGYAQTGSGSSAGNGGGSPAAAAPRPVAVVKPQKRATIGDMLRNSRVSDEYPPHPGQSGTGRPQPGGYDFAAVPPPPAQQQPEPAAIRRRPVDTGSSYGTRSAAVMSPEASAAPAAVQYNTDGSIVLSSKPIKLHKPAHLLPKTIGFQEAASERGPAAAASPLGQQLASSQQNFFGGPISRDY